jgi:hypothetical protein
MFPTIDDRRRELRTLLEGMKAEPGRRQMAEAYRFIALQRSIAVDRIAARPAAARPTAARAMMPPMPIA